MNAWQVAADLLYPESTASAEHVALEAEPHLFLRTLFPEHITAPFAAHHDDLWSWVWSIEAGGKPGDAFVAIWPRGGAKSTSAEMAVAALGARRRRRYCLYVCSTQDQADEHVGNIGALLESGPVGRYYPALGERQVTKYHASRGWRRDRLTTASGLVVDALGLDTAARGVKFDEQRPDLLVLDDVDDELDSLLTITRKVSRITRKLLPAGAPSLAVLAIQNLVHPDGVFARLADGRADFLTQRRVSGPIPAARGLVTEVDEEAGGWRVVAGEATWGGQGLDVIEEQINEWGLSSFLAEAQHDVDAKPGGMYDAIAFSHCARDEVPDLVSTTVWVDPAVTDTDQSDSHAVQADGIDPDGVIYRLYSWEGRTSPEASLRLAIRVAVAVGSRTVGVETDQGGDTWASVFRAAAEQVAREDGIALRELPLFVSDKASKQRQGGHGHGAPSKAARNARMLADYERPGRIVHVLGQVDGLEPGGCEVLERALRRFPRTKPFDLADAAFWSWQDLRKGGPAVTGTRSLASARLPSTAGTALLGRRTSPAVLRRAGGL